MTEDNAKCAEAQRNEGFTGFACIGSHAFNAINDDYRMKNNVLSFFCVLSVFATSAFK